MSKVMGRPVGAKSKNTVALKLDLLDTLRSKGFDPLAELIEVHQDAKALYKKRLIESKNGFGVIGAMSEARQAATDILEFVYPKLARSEMSAIGGKDLFESLGQFFVALDAQKKRDPSNT